MKGPVESALSAAPRSWSRMPLKYVADINGEVLFEDSDPDFEFRYIDISSVDSDGIVGKIPTMRFEDAPSRARRIVKDGDIIVSTVRTYLLAIARVPSSDGVFVASTGFAAVRPRLVDAGFLYWWTRSDPFVKEVVSRSVGVGYPGISPSDLGTIVGPLPPHQQQRLIGHFLDSEVARIDSLIAARRRSVDLLRQRREVVIDTLVAGGDSGSQAVGWGGSWRDLLNRRAKRRRRPARLKSLISLNDSGVWGDEPDGISDTIVLRSTEITRSGEWAIEEPAVRALTSLERSKARLMENDLLIVTSSGSERHIGKAAIVDRVVAQLEPAFSNFTQRLRPSRILPRYLWYFLNSRLAREQLRYLSSTTTGLRNLGGGVIGELVTPGLSIGEQARIISELDNRTEVVHRAIDTSQQYVSVLKERRQALITATVTGQLRVSDTA
jgi:type I restriction enzyme S subunit